MDNGGEYWTDKSEACYQSMMSHIRASDIISKDFNSFISNLETTLTESFEARELHRFMAALRIADEVSDISSHMRFKFAINAMDGGRYEFAYIAWDDNGRCWSDTSEAPDIPSSVIAARCLKNACKEILRLRAEVQSRDLAEYLQNL